MGSRGNPMAKSQNERIYSAHQLVAALRSGMDAVRDQLQVLTILDGTAASWPGVNQAIDDMQFLIDMSAQTTSRLEADVAKSDAKVQDCRSEVATLKETLALANHQSEEMQKESTQLAKDNRALTSKLEASMKEVAQQRQELWTLEKQRADLASEVEKYKQDNEFMEGEITTLRSTVTEQMQQLTACKEELAARKADLQHTKQSCAELKAQALDLRKQLDTTSITLRAAQTQLEHIRGEKVHFEKESERLGEEAARLGGELSKVTGDAARSKDWGEVVKKVEADKLREEQAAHAKTKAEAEHARNELDKTVVRLTAELASKDQMAIAKTAEAGGLAKQVGLLNLQLKDLQKQLTTLQAEKAAWTKDKDASKAEIARLQAKVQASAMQAAQLDKDRALAESRAKEASMLERTKLQAAQEECRKEAAVQKALADGWGRDLKDLQSRLKSEQATVASLQEQLEKARHNSSDEGRIEMVKNIATMEQVIRDLKAQLANKDTEMRKLKAETSSMLKMSEKQIEKLQRECNESAAEIHRMRAGDALRLPPLGRPQSLTLTDELDQLKKYVSNSFASDRGIQYTSGRLGTSSPNHGNASPKRAL